MEMATTFNYLDTSLGNLLVTPLLYCDVKFPIATWIGNVNTRPYRVLFYFFSFFLTWIHSFRIHVHRDFAYFDHLRNLEQPLPRNFTSLLPPLKWLLEFPSHQFTLEQQKYCARFPFLQLISPFKRN